MAPSSQPSPKQGAGPAAMPAGQGSPARDPSCHDTLIPLRNPLTSPGVGLSHPEPPCTGNSQVGPWGASGGLHQTRPSLTLHIPAHWRMVILMRATRVKEGGATGGGPHLASPGCGLLSCAPARTRLGSFSLTIGRRGVWRPPPSGPGPGPRCVLAVRGSPVTTVSPGCGGGCRPRGCIFR